MKYSAVRGYVQSIFCGLVVIAVIVLVLVQWKANTEFSLYGGWYEAGEGPNLLLLIVVAMVVGFLMPYLLGWTFGGIGLIRRARRQEAAAQTQRQVAQMAKLAQQQAVAAKPAPKPKPEPPAEGDGKE